MALDWTKVAQMGGSLIGISLLYVIAFKLKLGGDPRLPDEAAAMAHVRDALYGFDGVDAACDRAGMSALVRDAAGRHALLFRLGNRFVARLLTRDDAARLDQALLTIEVNEPGVAPVVLNLGEKAQYWAAGLRHIPHD